MIGRGRHREDDGRLRVLFVSTQRRPPLGADTMVHLDILRALDRSRVEAYAACDAGPRGRPTPTYQGLRQIPDLQLVDVDLGHEVAGGSRWEKLLAVLSLVPAASGVARLAWLISRRRIDVLHTTDRPRDAVVCVALSKVTRARSMVHLHVGFDPSWMRRGLQWAIRHADALVGVSGYVAGTVVDAGCDPARVHVVRNGIDLSRWSPGRDRDVARDELGIDGDTGVVLTVCRLFPSKGVGKLVEAMSDLRDDLPGAVLLVVGAEFEPGHLGALEEMARQGGVEDRVRFLGRRDDVPALMAAADVYAMPSDHEPFGLVFAEAMAMERPVVALANGGTPEVVEDGVTGLLSAAGDRQGLAAHLRALLVDPPRRVAMGAAGRRRVEALFTTQRMAADTVRVYDLVTRGAESDHVERPVAARAGAAAGSRRSGDGQVPGMRGGVDVDGQEFAAALDGDGYLVLRNVLSKDRLDAFREDLLAEFDQLVRDGLLFEGGGSYSGHLNCFPGRRARFILDDLTEAGVVDLVRGYRPEIADSVRPTLNFNLPGSVPQHYHMDDAFLKEFLICNVAVVDTDLVNGAIDLLPGTNQRYYEFWRYALERKYRLSRRVPMATGDVLIRKSTLWHRGMPNRSSTPRPMMAITFGEIDDPTADPFATNDGEIEFYANWFTTSRLGQLREKTFVKAPITYSSYRFVTSLRSKRGYQSWER